MQAEKAIREIAKMLEKGEIRTKEDLQRAKARVARKFGLGRMPKNAEIAKHIRHPLLLTKPARTGSGITPIAVMIEPLSCPFRCIYCPIGDAAKSYTGLEPAARRAKRNNFDPYLQAADRLKQYELLGHPTDKCHVIIMGGTYLSKSREYKEWFVKRAYDALNRKEARNLEEAIRLNERADHRVIGLTIETRPDYAMEEHINEMLGLTATLVELGVQAVNEEILRKVERGHGVKEVIESTHLLKDSAFKVTYHLMLGLTGLERKDLKKEVRLVKEVIQNPAFRPDMLKIYPTIVTRGTKLHELWRKGEYEPLTNEETIEILMKIKQMIPPWMRIMRVQRDVPKEGIVAGPNLTNMRQLVAEEMRKRGWRCRCIRCREVFRKGAERAELMERKYKASNGTEIFLSYEDPERDSIIGFLRLRFPDSPFRPELQDSALVRELHIYGRQVRIGMRGGWQHRGFGKALLGRAEELAKEAGYSRISIISGVGVREYYRNLGYRLHGPYMVKEL